ncbi:hypothetical protein ABIE56_000229 [Luteibacter sp. 621]|uniref:hypothetical protein n=1 Tax=Luteibacter sp. 621 TaxID=3373916 RepID=UPI003D19D5B5
MNEHDAQWFFVFFGLFCVIAGARQIVARKGILRGKSKKAVHFEGREAVVRGVSARRYRSSCWAIGLIVGRLQADDGVSVCD